MNGEATSSSEDAPWVSAMVGGKGSKADAIAARAAKQSLPKRLRPMLLNQVPTKWRFGNELRKTDRINCCEGQSTIAILNLYFP